MPEQDPPDVVAHHLVANEGNPARFFLKNSQLTIPTEPYSSGTPETTTAEVSSFDAVIEQASVEDGGLNVSSFGGVHLPATEWERVGLSRHQEHDAVDPHDPFTDMNRRLEVWASREDNLFEASDDDYRFDHLEPLPDDSPLLTEWNDQIDDEPDRPPVPIEYPTLTLYVTHGENAETDARGFDRIQVGTIVRIEPLDDLSEWPSEPDYEKRELDISLPSRHPSIDFGELDPLIWSDDILEAVFTINRHAKRLDIEADDAYQANAGAEARAYSIQKKALYSVKTIAIHRLVKQEPDKVNVTLHDLGETTMFCFDFGEFSFHQPREAVVDDLFDTVGLDPSELEPQSIDFEPSTNTDDLPKTLPEALATLKQVGLNANSHLDSTSVEDYNFGYHVSTTFDALK